MADTAAPTVTTTIEGDVAVIRMDDGKANAFSFAAMEQLHAGLDMAADAKAVALLGRAGRFSGGFDLSVMKGPDTSEVLRLVSAGFALCTRLWNFDRPVVAGCTGHAVAAGSIVLMSVDTRIGAAGDFKIGLNEVGIGMNLPPFAVELARERLSKRHFGAATQLARLFDPETAVNAGYLDAVVALDDVGSATIAEAQRLADYVDPWAFAITRKAARSEFGQTLTTLSDITEPLEAS